MTAKRKPGRKPMRPELKVIGKPVYLTGAEWKRIEKKFGSPTKAMRDAVLSLCK